MKDGNSLDFTANNANFNYIKIANGIFEHLNILNTINISTNVFDTEKPISWGNNTVFDASFNGNTNGGNVAELIGEVSRLDVQRAEQGSDDWITIQSIQKDSAGKLETNFTINDPYEMNGVIYSYRIMPIDSQGNQGTAIQKDVLSLFNDAYIADANHIYKITYEYAIGSSAQNQASAVYTPFGRKYPIVAYNAETNYESAGITAILIAPTSESSASSFIDRGAQEKLVREFNAWLTNGKAKILKDFNGKRKIITVVGSVSNNYYKELGNGLASTSFTYNEVGDFTQGYLDSLSLTNNFINQ